MDTLLKAGYGCTHVYRVISAGDSGESGDVVLYRNHENELYEAVLGPGGAVVSVHAGW